LGGGSDNDLRMAGLGTNFFRKDPRLIYLFLQLCRFENNPDGSCLSAAGQIDHVLICLCQEEPYLGYTGDIHPGLGQII